MFARLTFLDVKPEEVNHLKQIFDDEIVPVVKSQKGIVGVWLLEPTDPGEQFISLTEWQSRSDADAYESGGTYKQLVDKVKNMYKGKPTLKTYNIKESKVTAAMR